MAYQGYLLKVGNYEFPTDKIIEKTYKVSKKVQDLDSYRNANGVLKRNALSHTPYVISFDVKSMNNAEMGDIMSNLKNRFSVPVERKLSVTAYNPEDDNYFTQSMYLPDLEFTIKRISDTIVIYEEMTFEFIGY